MRETSLTKIQYFRKKTKEESESSSKKSSQKNDDKAVKQKKTKVHFSNLSSSDALPPIRKLGHLIFSLLCPE